MEITIDLGYGVNSGEDATNSKEGASASEDKESDYSDDEEDKIEHVEDVSAAEGEESDYSDDEEDKIERVEDTSASEGKESDSSDDEEEKIEDVVEAGKRRKFGEVKYAVSSESSEEEQSDPDTHKKEVRQGNHCFYVIFSMMITGKIKHWPVEVVKSVSTYV